jgi:wyosine [tRNA(Phe)-imidazoG37] synthetase (radical SAM superfamily)
LTPYKTCSLDCIFCQLGATRNKTIERKEYIPTGAVLAEIKDWMETNGDTDVVTLSGSGEPTLHTGFGEVLDNLKQYSIPTVLLTNSTLLDIIEVQEAALKADIVKASLSVVWHQRSFEWINRPHPELTFNRLIRGIKRFRSQFKGELWIEVFLVKGINSSFSVVEKISAAIKEIKPDRIHLNTAVRPPAEDYAVALPVKHMKELTYLFSSPAEIIPECNIDPAKEFQANETSILAMLQRRPSTMKQIEETFGMQINEVSKHLGNLMRNDYIRARCKNAEVYYMAVKEGQTDNSSI